MGKRRQITNHAMPRLIRINAEQAGKFETRTRIFQRANLFRLDIIFPTLQTSFARIADVPEFRHGKKERFENEKEPSARRWISKVTRHFFPKKIFIFNHSLNIFFPTRAPSLPPLPPRTLHTSFTPYFFSSTRESLESSRFYSKIWKIALDEVLW